MARLSACVLPAFLLAAAGASAATAPNVPRLVTTNPPSSQASPAQSLTPTIIGEAEPEGGVVVESYPFTRAAFGLKTRAVEGRTKNPTFEIQIFSGAGCLGSPVATDTAETFEGPGIGVTVPAETASTFSARQVDPGNASEPSACSSSLTYWEGEASSGGNPDPPPGGGNPPPGEESPPSGGGGAPGGGSSEESGSGQAPGGGSSVGQSPAPVGQSPAGPSGGGVAPAVPAGGKPRTPDIHTEPSGRADDTTPLVRGSAPGADSVNIYPDADCSGTPAVKGTRAQFEAGIEMSVAPNSESTFSALSIGAQRSDCSDPVTYTEDSTAPQTRITMGPGTKTRKRSVVFRFEDVAGDPPGTSFVCKVDKAKWGSCSSPFGVKHLKLGSHLLMIRATDLAGNVEPRPVKRRFRVVPPS